MKATNIQQKPFLYIISDENIHLFDKIISPSQFETDLLFYIFRPYSGRAKSSSSLLA